MSRDSECEHTQQATCRLLAAVDATLGQAHVAGRASAARTRLGPLFAELFALGRIRASAPLLPSEPAARPAGSCVPAARPTGSCVPRRTLDAQGTVTDASPRGEEQRRQRPCGLQLSLRGLSDETYPQEEGAGAPEMHPRGLHVLRGPLPHSMGLTHVTSRTLWK